MPGPLFAAALSTASSFLAKKGMDLLSSAFKGTVDKGVEKLTETIKEKTGIDIEDIADEKLTEEQIIKLKDFEQQNQELLLSHIEKMKEAEIEVERIYHEDRKSARLMQIEALKQDDKFSKRFIYVYASIVTILTFGYIFMVTLTKIDPANQRIVDTVLGFLLGVSLSAIIQFFFGSSKGSGDKQNQMQLREILSELTKTGS